MGVKIIPDTGYKDESVFAHILSWAKLFQADLNFQDSSMFSEAVKPVNVLSW